MTKKDEVMPADKWEFDASVTEVFDDMLERSIPSYKEMRRLCFQLGASFVKPGTDVVDLGCSRGGAIAPFVDCFGAHNRFVGVEVSPPMLAASRDRFKGYVECGVVEIRDDDLRRAYPPVRASLTMAVLTVQFIPIEHRQRVLRQMFLHTIPGGAVILVEKVLGASAELDSLLVGRYYTDKLANGYTQEQIDRKRLSLEGVLVPVTAAWNEELLRMAGFTQVDCFWRMLNFAGWIAVKEGVVVEYQGGVR